MDGLILFFFLFIVYSATTAVAMAVLMTRPRTTFRIMCLVMIAAGLIHFFASTPSRLFDHGIELRMDKGFKETWQLLAFIYTIFANFIAFYTVYMLKYRSEIMEDATVEERYTTNNGSNFIIIGIIACITTFLTCSELASQDPKFNLITQVDHSPIQIKLFQALRIGWVGVFIILPAYLTLSSLFNRHYSNNWTANTQRSMKRMNKILDAYTFLFATVEFFQFIITLLMLFGFGDAIKVDILFLQFACDARNISFCLIIILGELLPVEVVKHNTPTKTICKNTVHPAETTAHPVENNITLF